MAAAPATELGGGAGSPSAGTPSGDHPRTGRWAAVPAGVGVAGHVWLLASHPHGAPLTVLLAAMTLWCAWCTVEAWQAPTPRRLSVLLGMAVAMVAVHTAMVLAPSAGAGGHAHHGAGAPPVGAVAPGALETTAPMLLIIAVELGVAFACALALRQRRARASSAAVSQPRGRRGR